MTLAASQIIDAAAILSSHRRSGQYIERLPQAVRPQTEADALAIQVQVATQLEEAVAAWKCAMPNAGSSVLGRIHVSTVTANARCAARARNGMVRIEPELAYVLNRDLPQRDTPYAPSEIDDAVGAVHLALELIDSRYVDAKALPFIESLADGLQNQGLVVGPRISPQQEAGATRFQVSASTEQRVFFDQAGKHPVDSPRAPLYWLAQYMGVHGPGLKAGQIIITGAYVPFIDVPLAQAIDVRFGELGTMRVTFDQQ